MTEYKYLWQETHGGKIFILINNPPLNTLDRSMLMELNELLDEIEKNPELKEIVITSIGKYFCAGANIKELKEIVCASDSLIFGYQFAEGKKFAELGQKTLLKIHRFSKPVTVFITGICLGGGLELALACHKRIVVSHALLGFPETTLGLIPGWGGVEWIKEILKEYPEKIEKIVREGLYLDAKEARELGLVDEIIDSGQTVNKPPARPFSKEAAKLVSKEVVDAYSSFGLYSRLRIEAFMFGWLCEQPDAEEGITAFLEKRLPEFE